MCLCRQYPDPYVLNSRGNVQASLAHWKGQCQILPIHRKVSEHLLICRFPEILSTPLKPSGQPLLCLSILEREIISLAVLSEADERKLMSGDSSLVSDMHRRSSPGLLKERSRLPEGSRIQGQLWIISASS